MKVFKNKSIIVMHKGLFSFFRTPRGFVFCEKVFLYSCSDDRVTGTLVLLPECTDVRGQSPE